MAAASDQRGCGGGAHSEAASKMAFSHSKPILSSFPAILSNLLAISLRFHFYRF